MARSIRTRSAGRGRLAARVATCGAAALTIMALVSSGGGAYADSSSVVLPGGTGTGGYTLSAASQGLYIDLAGTVLTGGTSSVSGSYDGVKNEQASANGQGFLLSSQITGTGPSVSVDNTKGTKYTDSGVEGPNGDSLVNKGGGDASAGGPAFPADCAQGGGGGQSNVGGFLGLGCGYATATVDDPTSASPSGPKAVGIGNIAELSVDLAGILGAIGQQAAGPLCGPTGVGQIPTLGPILGTACDQILGTVNPSVQVNVGNAWSQITGSATQVAAIAHASTVDLSLFPGTNSGATPLLEVVIPSATAESCYGTTCPTDELGATGGWSDTSDTSLIKISGTLITALCAVNPLPAPLGCTGSTIEIPPNNSGTCAAALPAQLAGLLQITLACATANGNAITGTGAKVVLLGAYAPNGGIVVDTSGISTNSGAPPNPTGATLSSGGSSNPAVPTVAGATSAITAVHTGEWWAGSLPLLAVLAAMGGALLGWPRLRRFSVISRLVTRSGR